LASLKKKNKGLGGICSGKSAKKDGDGVSQGRESIEGKCVTGEVEKIKNLEGDKLKTRVIQPEVLRGAPG